MKLIKLVKFVKRNRSGESTRKTRPVKQELLQKIRNGEYKEVIVYKLDRWARSSRELILEIQELTDKGVRFVSLSDNLDFSTSTGRLHFHSEDNIQTIYNHAHSY